MGKGIFLLIGILVVCLTVFAEGDFIVDGKIGVGTSTPTTAIDVNGSSAPNFWYDQADGLGLRVAAYFAGEFTTKTLDDFPDAAAYIAYCEQDILNYLANLPSDMGGNGAKYPLQ